MKTNTYMLLVALCATTGLGADISTRDDTVSATVPDGWVIIGSQTKPPKTVVAFQIPNHADEGTPDSSNLSISTFEPNETNAMQQVLMRHTTPNVVSSTNGDWTVRVYRNKQEQTEYVIRDAVRRYSSFFVMVRLAWPHLKANRPDYDQEMERAFAQVLGSIKMKTDANQPKVEINQQESPMETTCKFLKGCGHYFIATVDKDQPRVRPFGTVNIFEGKLYIQTGRKKNVAKQILANPKVEICAFNGKEWIRVETTLKEDPRREAKKAMLDAYPSLRSMYSEDDENTLVLYMNDTTATLSSFGGAPKVMKF